MLLRLRSATFPKGVLDKGWEQRCSYYAKSLAGRAILFVIIVTKITREHKVEMLETRKEAQLISEQVSSPAKSYCQGCISDRLFNDRYPVGYTEDTDIFILGKRLCRFKFATDMLIPLPTREASKTKMACSQENPVLVKAVLAKSRNRKITAKISRNTINSIKNKLTGLKNNRRSIRQFSFL